MIKNQLLLAIIFTLFMASPFSNATVYRDCNTKLFKQLIATQNPHIKRANIQFTNELVDFAGRRELLCPMQIEKDFNGDNRKDWVGILELKGEIILAAYLSGRNAHTLNIIKKYNLPPNNQYLRAYSQKSLKSKAGEGSFSPKSNYSIVEVFLTGEALVYAWDGQKIKRLSQFSIKL